MISNPFRFDPNLTNEEHNALRIILIGLPASIVAASVYLMLGLQTGSWQLYAWSADIWLLALAVLISLFLLRRRQLGAAIWLSLSAIQVTFIAAVVLIQGIGLLIGISILALTAIIAGQTLPRQQVTQAVILGIAGGIAAILIEVFPPAFRLPPPPLIRFFLPGILLAVILLFGHVTARQFRNYSLRAKLIIIFVTIVLSTVGMGAFLTANTLRATLVRVIGGQLSALANSKALEIGQTLGREEDILELLTLNPLVLQTASAASTQKPLNDEEIARLDQQWRSADAARNDADPLVSSILNAPLSKELRQFQEEFPNHVEIFLTDRQGLIIAAANRTSDYYQGDEAWWRTAYEKGGYIGQPEYDEGSNAFGIIMAVRVQPPGYTEPIGVLRTTLNLSIFTNILKSGLFGQSGHTNIYLPNGQEIFLRIKEDGDYEAALKTVASLNINELLQSTEPYQETFHDETPILASHAPVADIGKTSEENIFITDLNWHAVSIQDQAEAFQPIQIQTRNIALLAILISLAATLAATGLAQVLAAPLTRLKQVAEKIAEGDTTIRANIESGDEAGALADAFNRMTSQLRDLITGLEQRVSERTLDLKNAVLVSEKRARDLQSISDISRLISSEQRLDVLLPLVTRLISERFGFYHVGIFFVDETRRFAILQAANSAGGQKMLARKHHLEIGIGLVGTVLQTGKPRIALDVGADAVFFNNPDLPNTRSEMALPLTYQGVTIGVLDVQSDKPGAFTENDTQTLSILADQVAIAIENARLFGQMQQAREEAEALYAQIQSREWSAFIRQAERIGYQQTATGGQSLSKPVMSEEIRKALKQGRVVVVDGDDMRAQPSLAVPVKLRGQTIGVLNIKAPMPNRRWNQDEINLAQAVSDRLALALDNARLLLESQRRAAKEAKIGEVSAKIGASINMRNVLQTAVEELGRALPGSEVIIQFGDTDGESIA
ncbi:MAG: hypothetical protein Kow0070_14820 [Anaerolineales bacterium]